jgi:hypothetical protein
MKNSIQNPMVKFAGSGRIHFTSPGRRMRKKVMVEFSQPGELFSSLDAEGSLFLRIRYKLESAQRIDMTETTKKAINRLDSQIF